MPYSEKVAVKIREKLAKLPFVTTHSKSKNILRWPTGTEYAVYLKHRRTDQADGIIGFAPNTSGSQNNLLITGEVNLSLQNLSKARHRVRLTLEKLCSTVAAAKNEWRDPLFAKEPNGHRRELRVRQVRYAILST